MATVDIAVPCYCYGHFLEECVGSILNQSLDDVRILIIDDASPDDSAAVARALARRDARIEVVVHATNKGHIATYNESIEWAASPYFISLSADDMLAPGALGRAVGIMEARPEVVLTTGACIEFHSIGELPALADDGGPAAWIVRPGREFIAEACQTIRNNIPTPTAIARTAVQKRIGGYIPELYHSGDLEMWLRFAAHGAIASTPEVQAFYRVHGTNMSGPVYRRVIEDYQQRQAAFDTFFAHDGTLVWEASQLQALAHRRLGDAAFWTAAAQLCRGRWEIARQLLHFAWKLNPDTRFWPPFAHLGRVGRPDRRALAALSDLLHRAS
jgi:glycosyltransferase involved in cell wall biosynthesis